MDDWIGLKYNDYDFSSYFEYNNLGEIRNALTKKKISQSGKSVVLSVDGETVRINLEKLLGRKIEGVEKNKKTQTTLDAKLEAMIRAEVKRQLNEIYEHIV